jgi:sec-independent protein translocase protein TatC
MAKFGPVSSEDRFTLVEHLSELRSRIFVSLGIFLVAFGFAFWQNGPILDFINTPLKDSQKVTAKQCTGTTNNDSQQSVCFERAVSKALTALTALPALNTTPSTTDSREQALAKTTALDALEDVRELAPSSTTRKPVTLGVAEPFFQTINVAMYGALVISLPLLLYQLYAFLIPAFTQRERRAIVPLLLGVPFLFYGGVAFGYYLALPRAVDFLQNFNSDNFDILVQAKDYYKFVAMFLAGSGVIFQVPVLVVALSRMGILSARRMRKQRGIVTIIAAVVAAVITPTPDAVTMLLMMAPLVVLFELSTLLALVLEKRSPVGGVSGRLAEWREVGTSGYRDDDEDDERYDDEDPDDPFDLSAFDDEDDGEEPDPDLLGDPSGPRVAGPADLPPPTSPPPTDDDWQARADELDADDPFADDDGRPSG